MIKVFINCLLVNLVFFCFVDSQIPSPWIYKPFKTSANEEGKILVTSDELIATRNGKLLQYSIKTTSSCENRLHPTIVKIKKYNNGKWEIVKEIVFNLKDCQAEAKGPINYDVIKDERYIIDLESSNFHNNEENIEGVAGIKYRLRFFETTNVNYERQPRAEEAAKTKLAQEFSGRKWESDDWGNEDDCGILGTQNNGLWRREYADIDPDYNSLEIWVNWPEGRGYGVMTINFDATVSRKQWTCGVEDYSHTGTARGHLNMRVDIDVSSGSAIVNINAEIHTDDITGVPDFIKNALKAVINNKIRDKFNSLKPDLENRIANEINNRFQVILKNEKIKNNNLEEIYEYSSSLIEALGIQEIINHQIFYSDFLDEVSGKKKINVYNFDDELNQEYIARKINEQVFQFDIDRIDTSEGFYFENLKIILKPTIEPGQIRIITAPEIVIIFDASVFNFNFDGLTNLWASGKISGNGVMNLSFSHTYQAEKIVFQNMNITQLHIDQAPGTSEFVRRKFNQKMPEKIRNNDPLLRRIAEVLNTAIGDAINSNNFSRKFLEREKFAQQLKKFLHFKHSPHTTLCSSVTDEIEINLSTVNTFVKAFRVNSGVSANVKTVIFGPLGSSRSIIFPTVVIEEDGSLVETSSDNNNALAQVQWKGNYVFARVTGSVRIDDRVVELESDGSGIVKYTEKK